MQNRCSGQYTVKWSWRPICRGRTPFDLAQTRAMTVRKPRRFIKTYCAERQVLHGYTKKDCRIVPSCTSDELWKAAHRYLINNNEVAATIPLGIMFQKDVDSVKHISLSNFTTAERKRIVLHHCTVTEQCCGSNEVTRYQPWQNNSNVFNAVAVIIC